MARDIWFTSDEHYFHSNMLKFSDEHGAPIRDFKNTEHMNEVMLERHNSVVRPHDKVYHCGDFIMRYDGKAQSFVRRLHGQKRLVVGNHDKLKNPALQGWFEKIMMWCTSFKSDGFLVTHVPIRKEQIKGERTMNLHGHIHARVINDPRYMNVCVEVTNYTPVHIDEVIKRARRI